MTLGDLEFKAEDFIIKEGYGTRLEIGQEIADKANHLLRERLEKAPEVFELNRADHIYKMDCCVDIQGGEIKIARGRLVCMEEWS